MTRAERKTARRELAEWLRARGLAPAGEVWRLADAEGVRDVDTLARAAAETGAYLKVTPAGVRMPMGLRDGLRVGDARVIGTPAVDPETGSVWVCLADEAGGTRDVEMAPCTPVRDQTTTPAPEPVRPPVAEPVRPRRTAPEWVQRAAADYRDARDAWEALRGSNTPAPAGIAGTAGSGVAWHQLADCSDAELAEVGYARPRYRDFLIEHAARQRNPAA